MHAKHPSLVSIPPHPEGNYTVCRISIACRLTSIFIYFPRSRLVVNARRTTDVSRVKSFAGSTMRLLLVDRPRPVLLIVLRPIQFYDQIAVQCFLRFNDQLQLRGVSRFDKLRTIFSLLATIQLTVNFCNQSTWSTRREMRLFGVFRRIAEGISKLLCPLHPRIVR